MNFWIFFIWIFELNECGGAKRHLWYQECKWGWWIDRNKGHGVVVEFGKWNCLFSEEFIQLTQ